MSRREDVKRVLEGKIPERKENRMIEKQYTTEELDRLARGLFQKERSIRRLDGWFLVKEIYEEVMEREKETSHVIRTALVLLETVKKLPVYLDENAVFAGTQRDAFARSYALINPNFTVSTFHGYCDPLDVFDDIERNETFTEERIARVRSQARLGAYASRLTKTYEEIKEDTKEAAYFVEQVTGHLIPDFRRALACGVDGLLQELEEKQRELEEKQRELGEKLREKEERQQKQGDKPQNQGEERARYETMKISLERKRNQYEAMRISLESVKILARRYQDCAREMSEKAEGRRKEQLAYLARVLEKIPGKGAENLFEAIQGFLLLWQVMCLEQTPNPFAFSVGNADRIFEDYRAKENLSREYAAGLFRHFLVFFHVGDRGWAISQNVMIGGRDTKGKDLTNLSSYALLDAFYAMNLPQPILSVKLHRNTPDSLYKELGKFLFTPGCLTPSFFNDDSLFWVLSRHGRAQEDLPDYAVAGCQEPLIMGKDNGNTTNSWLNLPKILELTLNDGKSLLTGQKIGKSWRELGWEGEFEGVLLRIRELFYKQLNYFLERMTKAANQASEAVSCLPVPFLSCFMGGIESGTDVRDTTCQGTKYNGSGVLIHGLSVVADSFLAIDTLLLEKREEAPQLLDALQKNFAGYEELHQFLFGCEKFGNNLEAVDKEAADIAGKVSDLVCERKNYLGNPFRPDFSTPSTHLIYGSLVGAMPSGRRAKEMLNYGVDPLYGEAQQGLGFRVLSVLKLPFEKFSGGYASHLGLDPGYFRAPDMEGKGMEFKRKVIRPLFFPDSSKEAAPFYLYVNITTPETLRMVRKDPQTYAPGGVYIMRIHGTFVNFLDLSPEIQEDIIKRLDLQSTVC